MASQSASPARAQRRRAAGNLQDNRDVRSGIWIVHTMDGGHRIPLLGDLRHEHFYFTEGDPRVGLAEYVLQPTATTLDDASDKPLRFDGLRYRASESIRYFHNQPMTEWGWQYDQFKSRNQDYMIYQRMAKDLTPPFPPVVVATESLADDGWRVYGRDLHLIEGTHRLSYLGRMLELGEILPTSLHKFVFLRPRFPPGKNKLEER